MSEVMDQLAGSPENPRPGDGGDGSTEPGTCQELLHRLRELEVGNRAGAGIRPVSSELGMGVFGYEGPSSQPPLPGWSRAPLRSALPALSSLG